MARRVPDAYLPWNYVASIGSTISILSTLTFLIMLYSSITKPSPITSMIPSLLPFLQLNSHDYTPSLNSLEWLEYSPFSYHTFQEIPLTFKS